MSVQISDRSKDGKNFHQLLLEVEMVIFHVVLLVVFLLHVCKFVYAEIQGFLK